MLLHRRKPNAASEGVFFIVRLPSGWQLCTFRFDHYGVAGLPDFWIEALGGLLNLWLHHFEKTDPAGVVRWDVDLQRAVGQLAAGYDAFPRGQVSRGVRKGRYVVRHSPEIARTMRVPHQEVEAAFGIHRHARWMPADEMRCSSESAARMRRHLRINEPWEQFAGMGDQPPNR